MADQRKFPEKSAHFDAHQSTKKQRGKHNLLANFMERFHSLSTLQLISGVCQVGLGVAVVVVCVLGLIRPLWVSTLLSIIASASVMTGIYFCYVTLTGSQKRTLIRDAMRRIVEDQN